MEVMREESMISPEITETRRISGVGSDGHTYYTIHLDRKKKKRTQEQSVARSSFNVLTVEIKKRNTRVGETPDETAVNMEFMVGT